MSYFVDAYTTIAQWCSVVRRLDGFNLVMSVEALDLKSDLMIDNASNITVGIENVDVFLPNKNKDILIKDCRQLIYEISIFIDHGRFWRG